MGLFEQFSSRRSESRAAKIFSKHPAVLLSLRNAAQALEKTQLKNCVDPQDLELHSTEIIEWLFELDQSENPIATTRQALTNHTIYRASYEILTIPPEPEIDNTGIRNLQGVSGKLRAVIPLLLDVDEFHRSDLLDGGIDNPSDLDSLNWVIGKYWVAFWYNQALRTMNACVGDNSHWHADLLHARCVWEEERYRRLLNWESAVEGDHFDIIFQAYSDYHQIILDGHADPALEWRRKYKEEIGAQIIRPRMRS
jgi:hypothetical protein